MNLIQPTWALRLNSNNFGPIPKQIEVPMAVIIGFVNIGLTLTIRIFKKA